MEHNKEKRVRRIITDNDKKMIIDLYNDGYSMNSIAKTMNYSRYTVKNIIMRNLHQYSEFKSNSDKNYIKPLSSMKKKRKSKEEIEKEVVEMFKKGYSIEKIIRSSYSSKSEIIEILEKNKLIEHSTTVAANKELQDPSVAISKYEISKFLKNCKVGDRYMINTNPLSMLGGETIIVEVEKIYKNFIKTTDSGCFDFATFITGQKVE